MNTDYTLAYGTHANPEDGRCAMEWVSHIAGEPHSDQPKCVSPVLRAICIALNDSLEDGPRQRLRPYLTRTIGTADDGVDEARSWMAMDWLIRAYAPAWLRVGGLDAPAQELCSLAPVLDDHALKSALPLLERARRAAHDQRCAARSAPWAAARAAAREMAWGCAGAAAWAAARLAVGDIAGDRARAAARAAAADAAAVSARSALNGGPPPRGRAATKDAARVALTPTVEMLRESVLGLLDRMLPTEPVSLGEQIQPASARSDGTCAAFTTSL
jgi:hypothetical protein